MSPFISYATNQGVPLSTITLILMLPVVVTIIAFFRQVVGIKAFGIYTPAMVTFAFFTIGFEAGSFAKGVKYGLVFFVMAIAVGTASRYLLRNFRLLYLPRVAILITLVSFVTLGLLIFGGTQKMTGWASVSIFPILIMITLVEKFVTTQVEKGFRIATILALETLLISLICYSLITWQRMISFIQVYPWVVFFTIVINIVLGKWTGLRLSEYYRFKDVLKYVGDSKKK